MKGKEDLSLSGAHEKFGQKGQISVLRLRLNSAQVPMLRGNHPVLKLREDPHFSRAVCRHLWDLSPPRGILSRRRR